MSQLRELQIKHQQLQQLLQQKDAELQGLQCVPFFSAEALIAACSVSSGTHLSETLVCPYCAERLQMLQLASKLKMWRLTRSLSSQNG